VFSSIFDERVVLSAELEGGAVFARDGTRVIDRFIAGGDAFRGFARNGLGPRDVCGLGECIGAPDVAIDDPLGGNYFGVLRLDASFPLGLPEEYGIYGGVFADVGSLWGLDDTLGSEGVIDDGLALRAAVGVSIFVDTAFAPLRFNFAQPILREEDDIIEYFRFTIQSRF
jgi:outer membrane protein insertion porin family